MAKTVYIECNGHLVYTMFGDRYELPSGKHLVTDVMPYIGASPGESEQVVKERIAQKVKAAFPQKITLSVEYPVAEVAEPVVEAAVEAASPVEASAPEKVSKPAAKKSAKRSKK